MDILNWLSIKRQQLIKTTPNDAKADLLVLGAEVPFTQRGDGYQTYGMPYYLNLRYWYLKMLNLHSQFIKIKDYVYSRKLELCFCRG